jgi:hypothetical protein
MLASWNLRRIDQFDRDWSLRLADSPIDLDKIGRRSDAAIFDLNDLSVPWAS